MRKVMLGIAVFTLAFVAYAQSPYQGQEAREIKALSPSEIDDYLSGKGMGFAKAAELNHYPGPKHVLDLADQLELTQEQRSQTQELFNSMQQEASALGQQLVEKERELDRRFADGTIDAETLQALVSEIGVLEAKIRYAHLKAHLGQKALLSQHQAHRYDQLRGYGAAQGEPHKHAH